MNESLTDIKSSVLVLGAGASHALVPSIPTMRNFFCELPCNNRNLRRILRFFYGVPEDSCDPSNMPDLESLWTFLESMAAPFAERRTEHSFSDADMAKKALKELKLHVNTVLRSQMWKDEKGHPLEAKDIAPQIHGVIRGCSPKPLTFLTLNYDLVLQDALPIVGTPYAEQCKKFANNVLSDLRQSHTPIDPQKYKECCYVLPLHGSLGILCCSNRECPNCGKIIIACKGTAQREGALCRSCGSKLHKLIVPPSLVKSYQHLVPKMGLIWALALDRLRCARKVVFWGVGVTPSDYELCRLMKEGLNCRRWNPEKKKWVTDQTDIDIINPSEEAVRRSVCLLGADDGTEAYVRWFEDHSKYPDSPKVEGKAGDFK